MGRRYDFGVLVKRQAFQRQWNQCGHCGHSLINQADHAHHVIPHQLGLRQESDVHFIASVDNCVVLCEMCHERVHQNGRYRTGAVAPPEYYSHSHGPLSVEHLLWASKVNQMWDRILKQ